MLDPRKDPVLVEPRTLRPGYWAGAPSAIALDGGGTALVVLDSDPNRGGWGVRIVESRRGLRFDSDAAWSMTRDQAPDLRARQTTGSSELGRFCLRAKPGQSGEPNGFSLYTSWCGDDGRWCVGVMHSATLDGFRPADVQPVLMPEAVRAHSVRDPWVLEVEGVLYLYVATEMEPGGTVSTGLTVSSNGGESWTPLSGSGIPVGGDGWPARVRLASLIAGRGAARGRWLALIDTADTTDADAPGRVRLAISDNGRRTWSIVTEVPGSHMSPYQMRAPWTDGSVQYTDVIDTLEQVRLVYECTTPSGGRDIRQATIARPWFDEVLAGMS